MPKDSDRAWVARAAAMGIPIKSIAAKVGISDSTLYRYYREDIDEGLRESNIAVAGALFTRATRGDGPDAVAAQKFWLMMRGGPNWKQDTMGEDAEDIDPDESFL